MNYIYDVIFYYWAIILSLKFIFMYSRPDEVHSIIMGRLVLKYAGPEIDAMKAIAQASHKRSMADFQAVCVVWFLI